MKYNLTITENQLHILQLALDVFSRVGTGQIEEIIDHANFTELNHWKIRDSAEFRNFKRLLTTFEPNASAGITSPKVKQRVKEAYAIYKEIDKALWEAEADVPQHTVRKDGDILRLAKEPKIKLAKLED